MPRSTIAFATVLKTILLVSSPALAVMLAMVVTRSMEFSSFMYGYTAVVGMTALFVVPMLSNLSSLTQYVDDLAQDKRAKSPDLKFFSNMTELPGALSSLQRSWDQKKFDMESIISEREILVDTLPDILIMLNEQHIIVRTNRAARHIFGQNLAGKHIREIIDSDKLLNALAIVTQDYLGQEVEFHMEMPNPSDFRAVMERFPIESVGNIAVVITLTDITQLKRIQRMRADFVANASHEIRTPLASIIGFIETLRGPAKDDEVAREEFLKVMADQAERMSKLVNDLLSLSKIEMNSASAPSSKVDVLRIIRSEKTHFEWACKQKNLTMRLKLHDTLPSTKGDEDELAQIVRNLMSNAVKYSYPDSEITVTARITAQLPDDPAMRNLSRAIQFSVKDQGEGIPAEHIPRLTERFYRVDSARTRKVGGTGLGLAIVKHVLNRHQGVMTIDSLQGEGTTFSVFLPVYDDVMRAAAA